MPTKDAPHQTRLPDAPKRGQVQLLTSCGCSKEAFRSAGIPLEGEEQLGIDLQKLGCKLFPTTESKELFKGRFYQALHPPWQWKLNVPRTFTERARMLKQPEEQFTASAA